MTFAPCSGYFLKMDSSKFSLVIGLFSLTFALNVPFGYLRSRTRKLPLKILYIHLPIPIIILGRIISNLDYGYIPLFVLAAVLGQLWGGKP